MSFSFKHTGKTHQMTDMEGHQNQVFEDEKHEDEYCSRSTLMEVKLPFFKKYNFLFVCFFAKIV